MSSPDKLPLVKTAMRQLAGQLTEEDRVSIVVYAGAAGVVLEPTNSEARIKDAITRLNAGGSTAGGAGIQLAYSLAEANRIEGGVNRVILATDGDFNVGISDKDALIQLIEQKRESGTTLTVLGFGRGNLNDAMMEQIADHGNGNYFYIDSPAEARKVLGSFLFTGDDGHKLAGVLSGGEKTRLALAMIVVSGANVLLLDEPTNNLDLAGVAQLESALAAYRGAFIVVSHDAVFLDRIGVQRWIRLLGGRVSVS